MKTSTLIDKLYNTTGIDAKAVSKKYKLPAVIGAGIVAGGAMAMPKSEKKILSDSIFRDRDRFPEYDSLGLAASRTVLPGYVGTAAGLGLGALAARKGLGKKQIQKVLDSKKSLIVSPALNKLSGKFGERKIRMATGGIVGAGLGGHIAGKPFEAQQSINDYHSGMKRYDGNKKELLSLQQPHGHLMLVYMRQKRWGISNFTFL